MVLSFFFFVHQTSTNVRVVKTSVTQTQTASILLVPTAVSVSQDTLEVESAVNVSTSSNLDAFVVSVFSN